MPPAILSMARNGKRLGRAVVTGWAPRRCGAPFPLHPLQPQASRVRRVKSEVRGLKRPTGRANRPEPAIRAAGLFPEDRRCVPEGSGLRSRWIVAPFPKCRGPGAVRSRCVDGAGNGAIAAFGLNHFAQASRETDSNCSRDPHARSRLAPRCGGTRHFGNSAAATPARQMMRLAAAQGARWGVCCARHPAAAGRVITRAGCGGGVRDGGGPSR